ncbi:hypothetical protein Syun_001452 [Stephania yunnanensis]|uniref:Uncharacterized protein n=1 Tax=Stephania yunnanensis TaxID=152371 RepID=A0AAP0Q6A4_9MAGN
MSHPQVLQHEGKSIVSSKPLLGRYGDANDRKFARLSTVCNNIRKLDFSCPGSKDLVEDYLIETSEECEIFQIEPEIAIALNEGEDEMNIYVNSDMSEKPQIESEEDQLLVLVQLLTLPCTFGTPYKGVEVRERLQIFYTADTFVLDDPDTIDSFVLEVPDELLNLKEGMHASLPN